MVINNLHVGWAGRFFGPFKTNPPLVMDADAVLTLSVAPQSFEWVPRQRTEISELDGCFQTIKLEPCSALNSRERLDSLTGGEVPGPLVPVADDHSFRNIRSLCVTSSVIHYVCTERVWTP